MQLFLALLIVPIVEIWLFIQIGGAIGLGPTLLVVILTAALGTYLLRREGLAALEGVRQSVENLEDPSGALAHGALVLLSAAFLLTPGFFTDTVGLGLLVPAFRHWLLSKFGPRVVSTARARYRHSTSSSGSESRHEGPSRSPRASASASWQEQGPAPKNRPGDEIMDVEWEEIAPPPDKPVDSRDQS